MPGIDGTGGTSGCVTADTHTGSVVATTQPPYYISTLCKEGSVCCDAGQVADVPGSCADCPSGKYTAAATDANVPGSCADCPLGTYQNSLGSDGCLKCEPGMLSNPTLTACGPCQPGEFADTKDQACRTCEPGTYAPSAQENACLACAAGSFTNDMTAATECTPCQAGKSSTNAAGENAGAGGCVVCPAGTSSSYGQFECTACSPGRYAPSNQSSSCTDCEAGKFQALLNATSCAPCAPGYLQVAAGQAACSMCPANEFSDKPGAYFCNNCEVRSLLPSETCSNRTRTITASLPCPRHQHTSHASPVRVRGGLWFAPGQL